MPTRPEITQAARFEYGIRPDQPRFPGSLMAQLSGPDPLDDTMPVTRTAARMAELQKLRAARADAPMLQQAKRALRQQASTDMMRILARMVRNPRGFRERLFAFWIDHFTVSPNRANEVFLLAAYFEDAIRAHIGGSFADMLKAAITHPSMLFYLDQSASVGPGSPVGQRRSRGLNENLAREVLELHTLGVDGPYTQADIRQFAELLTGIGIGPEGMRFVPNRAEPGAESILGQSYGGGGAQLADILGFLDDLAIMPATARHLAQKLAVHFIGPAPPPDLVADMAAAYLATGGALAALYEVLTQHPSARAELFPKVRPPFEYIATALRALDVDADIIAGATAREANRLGRQLTAMGQRPFRPGGPDGWPEAAESWITPPQLAARISWAGQLARTYAKEQDPRMLLSALLGNTAPAALSFSVRGAESKSVGVALLLASPALMRR